MEQVQSSFEYQVFDSIDTMPEADKELLAMAQQATAAAYAPYSNFHVGAAVLLNNGKTVQGTNQENASYPVGICAERVLLSAVASQHPGAIVETMAISYDNKNGESITPVAPCGMCRQALVEFEGRQHNPIRLILGGLHGKVYIIKEANVLLPLSFSSSDLK